MLEITALFCDAFDERESELNVCPLINLSNLNLQKSLSRDVDKFKERINLNP